MKERKWNARIQRARDLEKTYHFATEGLRFYQRVAEAQETLYCELVSRKDNSGHRCLEDNFRQELDFPFLLPRLQRFLSLVEESAPATLARSVRDIRSKNGDHSKEMLTRFWVGSSFSEEDLDPVGSLLSWAFLQPYAEYLADQRKAETMDGTPSTCPLCGSNPIVGVLRREGDGARKSLVCMLCAHEWAFRRVYCASCGEEREPQMAFYSAPEIPHVRVDVCDTCHTYLKSVDLTKMGLAVPIVDELATIPLDLWAREHGYHKLQTNLLGT